jgi:DnaJ-class molecular chaperone
MGRQFFVIERTLCNGCFGSGEQGATGKTCFHCKGECYQDKRVSLAEALAELDLHELLARVPKEGPTLGTLIENLA